MKPNTHPSRTASRNLRRPRSPLLLTIGLIIVLSSAVALAQQLCFNPVTSSTQPPNWGQPPLIDGLIATGDPRCFNGGNPPPLTCSGPDLGWTNSFSYVYNKSDGPVTADVIVEGITQGNYLYLSVQANNTTPTIGGATDPLNAVVVAFDPDNKGDKMQWFVIYPVSTAGTGAKQNAGSVTYYYNETSLSGSGIYSNVQNSQSWLPGNNGSGAPGWVKPVPPSALWTGPCSTIGVACIQSYLDGPAWSMEMALPITGDPTTGLIIPTSRTFGMYIDVLRVIGTASSTPGWEQWDQASWPPNNPMPGCSNNQAQTCPLEQSIPQTQTGGPSGWGMGTVAINPSPACNGVSIGSQNLDITVTNSLPTTGTNVIEGNGANTFNANVHNTAASAANNVGITFFIANFGLPSEWQQVAQAPAVSAQYPGGFGTATIPSGGIPLSSQSWTPPLGQYSSNPHQCILATLSSNPPISNNTTFFTNYSAVQNMNFTNLSRAESPVEVSSKGYPVNPQHNTEQEFDITVRATQKLLKGCSTTNNPTASQTRGTNNQAATQPPDCTSQIVEIAEACRHTGTYLSSGSKQKIELCQSVGSFGFVGKHQGTLQNWSYSLTGSGLGKPDSNSVYHLRMPNNSVVTLKNVIETGEGAGGGGRGCSHASGGAVFVFPLGAALVGAGLYWPRRRKRSARQPEGE